MPKSFLFDAEHEQRKQAICGQKEDKLSFSSQEERAHWKNADSVFDFGFLGSRTVRNTFLLFKSP